MSRDRDNPPTGWAGSGVVTVDVEVGIYAMPITRDGEPAWKVWHWCPKESRWIGAGVDDHQLVSADPLHLEPSLLMDWCCGLHGFIRDGMWTSA